MILRADLNLKSARSSATVLARVEDTNSCRILSAQGCFTARMRYTFRTTKIGKTLLHEFLIVEKNCLKSDLIMLWRTKLETWLLKMFWSKSEFIRIRREFTHEIWIKCIFCVLIIGLNNPNEKTTYVQETFQNVLKMKTFVACLKWTLFHSTRSFEQQSTSRARNVFFSYSKVITKNLNCKTF